MSSLPRDVSDLYLAPVVLAVDTEIHELGKLDPRSLSLQVALATNRPDGTREEREAGLLATLRHRVDCHDWEVSWDPRGVRLTHDKHTLVLGAPASFQEYVSGADASH